MVVLLSLAVFALAASPAFAQSKVYKWQFQDSALYQQTIPACTRLPIDILSFDTKTNSTKGSPPYYMIALEIGGTPTTTLIGTSDTKVEYTVTHPVGTRLLLSVTDSIGSPGGTFAPVTVTAGTSSSCFQTPVTSPAFTVTANITTDLSTCQPLELSISGGTSPYHLTLVADNAPTVTNDTFPVGDNIYTYINRASPGGLLVAAISDSTGRWATGTPIFNTKGSADTSCSGLTSSTTKGDVKPPSSSGSAGSSTPSTSPSTGSPNTLTVPGSSTASGSSASTSSTSKAASNAGAVVRESKRASLIFAVSVCAYLLAV